MLTNFYELTWYIIVMPLKNVKILLLRNAETDSPYAQDSDVTFMEIYLFETTKQTDK